MPLKWLAEKAGKVPITNRIVFEDKKHQVIKLSRKELVYSKNTEIVR